MQSEDDWCWIKVGSKYGMTSVLIRKGKFGHRETQGGEGHVKMKAKVRVVHLQVLQQTVEKTYLP
jgi:hypothetical protein